MSEVIRVRERVWLSDRFHDLLGAPPAHPPEVLPDPIEDHDGVVERVADDREHGREHGEVELEPEHGEEAEGDEHVVHERGDRPEREPVLEAQPDVDEDPEQRDEHGEPAVLGQLLTDLGPYELDPAQG